MYWVTRLRRISASVLRLDVPAEHFAAISTPRLPSLKPSLAHVLWLWAVCESHFLPWTPARTLTQGDAPCPLEEPGFGPRQRDSGVRDLWPLIVQTPCYSVELRGRLREVKLSPKVTELLSDRIRNEPLNPHARDSSASSASSLWEPARIANSQDPPQTNRVVAGPPVTLMHTAICCFLQLKIMNNFEQLCW